MPQVPVWPFSIGDYMQDTVALSAEEHGAYLLLLMAQWSNGGTFLPNDPDTLARICRMPKRRWANKIAPKVLRFLTQNASGVGHLRIAEDYQRVSRKIAANRANAARGGRAKALKDKEAAAANGDTSPGGRTRRKPRGSHSDTASARHGETLPTHEPYSNPLPLDDFEAAAAAQILKRIEAEVAARWPDDPTPRDTRMLAADCADFARQGATVSVFDAAMKRFWPRMTHPPSQLATYRADVIALVRRWIAYKRWVAGGRKRSSPWRADWGAPPGKSALARFVIPAAYRKPGEAGPPMKKRSRRQEG